MFSDSILKDQKLLLIIIQCRFIHELMKYKVAAGHILVNYGLAPANPVRNGNEEIFELFLSRLSKISYEKTSYTE